jgi:hypothetical protein
MAQLSRMSLLVPGFTAVQKRVPKIPSKASSTRQRVGQDVGDDECSPGVQSWFENWFRVARERCGAEPSAIGQGTVGIRQREQADLRTAQPGQP